MPIKVPQIKGLPTPLKPNEIQGYDLLAEPYANVFLCAQKKSGKSYLISHMLNNFVGRGDDGKRTKVHAFVSTLHNDVVWQAIAKKHKGRFYGHGDINELGEVVDGLTEDAPLPTPEEEMPGPAEADPEAPPDIFSTYKGLDLRSPTYGWSAQALINDTTILSDMKVNNMRNTVKSMHQQQTGGGRKPTKKRKYKRVAARAIIVADDLGDSIQAPVLTELYKRNRHYKIKTITSSQNYNDISKQARLNMDYIIMFKGQSMDRLKKAANEVASFVTEKEFIDAYRKATAKPYGFLVIDRVENELSASG